ncbi:hypothetical protein MMC15_004688 [Xylographa vitiligo]|nr:hypothetical protein [Xylographa vitiligo]
MSIKHCGKPVQTQQPAAPNHSPLPFDKPKPQPPIPASPPSSTGTADPHNVDCPSSLPNPPTPTMRFRTLQAAVPSTLIPPPLRVVNTPLPSTSPPRAKRLLGTPRERQYSNAYVALTGIGPVVGEGIDRA